MLLAIDVGNTNIEFGVYEKSAIKARFRLGTNRDVTSDEIGLFLSQFFMIHHINKERVADIVISSVVPQVMYSMNNAMNKYIGKRPLIVGENLPYGIENRYDNPREVGADRLVNGVSGFRRYGGPLIIVDFGTATTFDAISSDGAYLGGAIYPGIRISMEALFNRTAKLPRVELLDPGHAIGTNTPASIQAGVIHGYVGAVNNIVDGIKTELGGGAKVIGTGGLAALISQNTPIFHAVDRNLTLDGLNMIYENHKPARL